MTQAEFEKALSRRFLRRRLIEVIIAVLFLAFGIVFHSLWQANKEMVTIPENSDDGYILGISVGFAVGFCALGILLQDLLLCKFKTIQKGQQYLTVSRGLFRNSVFVDGCERVWTLRSKHCNVVELWLKNRIRVTVSFSATPFHIAHISFSDDTASIEV